MRYAVVEQGLVVNVVVADDALAAAKGWIRTDEAGPGWTYNGIIFIAPPPLLSPPIPDRTIAARAKLALVPAGPIRDVFKEILTLL